MIKAGLSAAFLYAISPLVIQYSRSSWNPNLMPFFSTLVLYSAYKGIQQNKWQLFLVSGILLGIAVQLHYLSVFLGVILFLFLLLANMLAKEKSMIVRNFFKQCLSAVAGFLIGFSPFLAFEIKHGFPNILTIINFVIFQDPKAPDLTYDTFPQIISDVFFRVYGRLVAYFPPNEHFYRYAKEAITLWRYGVLLLGIFATAFIFYKLFKSFRQDRNYLKYLLFSIWIGFGIVLFGIYKKPIYDYYFGFMFPVPFLLVGNLLSRLFELKFPFKIISVLIFIVLVYLNWLGYPFRQIGNNQYRQVRAASEFILEKANGRPFNFALITGGNSDHAYRYIFEVNGKPPTIILNPEIDPKRKSVTGQLFIICEEIPCSPEGNSLWEVAGFGRAQIKDEWNVSVLKVYKLVHYKGE